MRRMILPPAVLAVVLSLAPQAVASTASFEQACSRGQSGAECSGRVTVTAGPGERNRVTFNGFAPGTESSLPVTVATVVDRGAPLRAGTGCEQVSANTVRCDPGRSPYRGDPAEPVISTGDGADRVTIAGGSSTVLGGSGNDTIVAVNASYGGTLRGGAGDDRIRSRAPLYPSSGDVLEGGPGDDALSGWDGQPLKGGSGNDRLTGSEQDDEMDGGSGNDRLVGRAGADRLKGGSGRDRIDSRDRSRDRVDCGRGRDRLRADRRDRVRRCERVRHR
jgi:Ca2+-binding RTX toxin-like protein